MGSHKHKLSDITEEFKEQVKDLYKNSKSSKRKIARYFNMPITTLDKILNNEI